ncbi:MAG: polysaccharide deacetylase family protein [Thermodesulfovibrionales bacterium]
MNVRLLTVSVLVLTLLWFPARGELQEKKERADARTPILLYHRFGPVVADSMTVTTNVFESHLKYFKDNGYAVIPLRQLVDYYLGKGSPPPSRSVVIVADDGHKSVYTDMFPLIKKYHIPVTLFIYPSAISNASYAMTWEQLREMKKTGLIDFESHSYWHPNFKKERRRLNPDEYERFVKMQLKKSKEKIEKELGGKIDMLAWPFGIYDDDLIRNARETGYVAAFTIERRHASTSEKLMTLPRYLMTDADRGKAFESIVAGASPQRNPAY